MATPAKKSGKDKDVVVVDRDEENVTVTVKILGEQFLLSADANGWIQYLASTGQAEHMERLLKAVLLIDGWEEMDETDLRLARMREWGRFDELLGSQSNFGIERMFRLVNDIIEATGNASTD